MENKEPLSPHIQIYKWHISSLVSISHRITGIINIVAITFICLIASLLILGESNYGIINFFITIPTFVFLFLTGFLLDESNSWDANKFNLEIKVLISVSLISITYHIFSGLRHLIIDFSNYGHEIEQARTSAIVVFLFTFLLSFFLIMEVW